MLQRYVESIARTFFRECNDFDQKKKKIVKCRICTITCMYAKTLILQVYWPIFPRRRLTSHLPRNRRIFARYIFIRPFLFPSLRCAPDRGTNRNASKRGDRREKLCGVYGMRRGQWGHGGRRAIGRTAESAEMRRGTIKSEGYERDGRPRRGGPPRKKLRKRFVSRRDGIATWLRIAGTSELPRPPALRDCVNSGEVRSGAPSLFQG